MQRSTLRAWACPYLQICIYAKVCPAETHYRGVRRAKLWTGCGTSVVPRRLVSGGHHRGLLSMTLQTRSPRREKKDRTTCWANFMTGKDGTVVSLLSHYRACEEVFCSQGLQVVNTRNSNRVFADRMANGFFFMCRAVLGSALMTASCCGGQYGNFFNVSPGRLADETNRSPGKDLCCSAPRFRHYETCPYREALGK